MTGTAGFRQFAAVGFVVLVSVAAAVMLAAGSAPAAAPMSPAALKGKAQFKSKCATCHILKAAGAMGTVGPNLDTLKLSKAKIAHQISAGGSFMPSFGGKLSTTIIGQIAAFVYAAEH